MIKKYSSFLALFCLLSVLFSCTANRSSSSKPSVTTEKKIDCLVKGTREGKQEGNLAMSHRRLPLEEIAKHMELEEETTLIHIKEMKIHGFYQLIPQQMPSHQDFILYQVNLAGHINSVKLLKVDELGRLYLPSDQGPIQLPYNYLFFSNYLPGEPVDFVLGSKDGTLFAITHIVPNPIGIKDSKNRCITVELISPKGDRYLVHGTGFEPFGVYSLVSRFETEALLHTVEANERGEFYEKIAQTLPYIMDGDATVDIRGDGIKGVLSLKFPWEKRVS